MIILITVLYKFGEIPTYIGVDEAGMIYDAYCLEKYGTDRYMNSYPLYLTNFGSGQSIMGAYLIVLCIKIFGNNMIAYRLPTLIIYLISVLTSYLFIKKTQNKKVALLFTFLIITCPWNIFNARMGLDCNLYAGLFMIDLYVLDRARKNYQYFIAGICIGLTLYTYCLSWITIPIFLAIYLIYMLYIRKINVKQILILGIPIFILSMPLIYFLLFNYGIVNLNKFGSFTLPILSEFRGNQISINNIFKTGIESLKTIFLADGTIYIVYIPLFLIGYIVECKKALKEIKNKKYGSTTIMIIAFTTLLIGLLTTRIPTPNKANVLYIPILYFVTIAILTIVQNSKLILFAIISVISMLTISYEIQYYKVEGIYVNNWYQDKYLYKITQKIEEDKDMKNLQKYVLAYRCGPHIYTLLGLRLSPTEYMNSREYKEYANGVIEISKLEDYNYLYIEDEIKTIDLNENNYVFIITNNYTKAIEYLENNGYTCENYGYYRILTKKIH